MTRALWVRLAAGFAVAFVVGAACGDDDGSGEQAGQPCGVPNDCFPGVDPADLSGDIICLDRVPDGYCTHLCQTDADCCAVPGECDTDLPQVCGPFESTGMFMCFLSCENADLGGADPETYCSDFAHPVFGCRSTGGGSQNRKVCVP